MIKPQKKEITFNNLGQPRGLKITNYTENGRVGMVQYMSIENFIKNQKVKKQYLKNPAMFFKSAFSTQLPQNVQNVKEINMAMNNYVAPPTKYDPKSPHYDPTTPTYNYNTTSPSPSPSTPSPNAGPKSLTTFLAGKDGCQPKSFLYRQFKSRSYFNSIKSMNNNGFSNVAAVPRNIQKGLNRLGGGGEGVGVRGVHRLQLQEEGLSQGWYGHAVRAGAEVQA